MRSFQTRARQLRARQTSAEAKLWHSLRNRKLARWKFRRQHPINGYVVDFVTLDGKLIVEVDGATHGSAAETRRDRERTRILESSGFRVLRVWNTDVYENLDGVLQMIFDELATAAGTPSPAPSARPLPGGERSDCREVEGFGQSRKNV